MLQKKGKVRKGCTSTSLSPSEVKLDSVNPHPTRDPIRQDWRDEGWVMLGTWLGFHLQLFHLIPQSSVQEKAGIQGGRLPSPLVLLFNRHYLFLFGNWYRRYGLPSNATKDLLVFRRPMSLTCVVKLKSLWRTTSLTWSSLVSRM